MMVDVFGRAPTEPIQSTPQGHTDGDELLARYHAMAGPRGDSGPAHQYSVRALQYRCSYLHPRCWWDALPVDRSVGEPTSTQMPHGTRPRTRHMVRFPTTPPYQCHRAAVARPAPPRGEEPLPHFPTHWPTCPMRRPLGCGRGPRATRRAWPPLGSCGVRVTAYPSLSHRRAAVGAHWKDRSDDFARRAPWRTRAPTRMSHTSHAETHTTARVWWQYRPTCRGGGKGQEPPTRAARPTPTPGRPAAGRVRPRHSWRGLAATGRRLGAQGSAARRPAGNAGPRLYLPCRSAH